MELLLLLAAQPAVAWVIFSPVRRTLQEKSYEDNLRQAWKGPDTFNLELVSTVGGCRNQPMIVMMASLAASLSRCIAISAIECSLSLPRGCNFIVHYMHGASGQ